MNIINGKMYIGKTFDIIERWQRHKSLSLNVKAKDNKIIHKALNKYGIDNFIFRIIQSFNSNLECLNAEKYWISYYKTNIYKFGNDFGYNLTDGGEGMFGYKLSQSSKDKISKSRKGLKMPQSFKEQRSLSYSGAGNPHYGKHHSMKSKMQISSKRKENQTSKGINNPKNKLTEAMVIEIKLLLKSGVLQKEIAKQYNVYPSAIQKIASGKNWSYITI